MKNDQFLTLAFESSCDETSVAVVADGRKVLSNIISSQIKVHQVFGGVVPEIASRHHLENVNSVMDQALAEANVTLEDIDLIGVTKGPGLIGALLIGLASAKAIAYTTGKPISGAHHLHGHISANYLQHPDLEPPFLALVISGGHTSIVDVKGYNEFQVLGQTRDDAAGEAFDKVARVLGLGYPGGPLIDKAAKEGDPKAIEFKRVFLEKDSLDFSFSGIKTGVLNYLSNQKNRGIEVNANHVAAGFQQAVMDVIVSKVMMAAKQTGRKKIALAGGVAANSQLRAMMEEACEKNGIRLFRPAPILCTDNAAMIGCAAYYRYKEGFRDDLYMDAYANLNLETCEP